MIRRREGGNDPCKRHNNGARTGEEGETKRRNPVKGKYRREERTFLCLPKISDPPFPLLPSSPTPTSSCVSPLTFGRSALSARRRRRREAPPSPPTEIPLPLLFPPCLLLEMVVGKASICTPRCPLLLPPRLLLLCQEYVQIWSGRRRRRPIGRKKSHYCCSAPFAGIKEKCAKIIASFALTLKSTKRVFEGFFCHQVILELKSRLSKKDVEGNEDVSHSHFPPTISFFPSSGLPHIHRSNTLSSPPFPRQKRRGKEMGE